MRGNVWHGALGALVTAGMMVLGGCGQNSTPGGPGATEHTTNKPVIGENDNSFRLSTPTLSTSIKQGETKDVKIGISRGNNFDQDVALKFSDLPQGVTIDSNGATLKHDAKDLQVTINAAPDAAVGDFTGCDERNEIDRRQEVI